MSLKLDEFVRIVETIAPPSLAYDWDNTGLLVRCGDKINSVLITLDVTHAVVDEAIAQNCDMILSHHPTLFTPIKSLNCNNAAESVIMRLVKEDISLYAAHTSYDRAKGGINDILANKFGLKDVEIVSGCGEDLMRTGYLPIPHDKEQLIGLIKQVLEVKNLKISNTFCDTYAKIAIVAGSGGDFVGAAKKSGANVLITGEAKHHHFIEAETQSVLLVEAGHYNTECYFVDEIFMSLQSCLNKVQLQLILKKVKCEQAPYEYIAEAQRGFLFGKAGFTL